MRFCRQLYYQVTLDYLGLRNPFTENPRVGGSIVELDVNPLFVLPDGQGVVAVDALIKIA